MKKILFIIGTYSMGGGAERVLKEILENISINKYEIDVLECGKYNNGNEPYLNNINYLEPILDFTIGAPNKWKYFIYRLSRYIKYFGKAITPNTKYDVIISFNYMFPSIFASIMKCNKRIMWIHSSIEDLDYHQYKGICRIDKYISYMAQLSALKTADNIVTISEKTSDSVIKLYKDVKSRIKVITNGLNIQDIITKSKLFKVDCKRKFRLITVQRLDRNKNIGFMIEVMSKLVKKYDVDYLILGKGEKLEELKEQVRKLDLEGNVSFLGFQPNPYPYILSANLVCLSSYIEGSPVIIAESLALGIPFISADVGGVKEFSNEGKCGIVAERKVASYVNEISKLFDNPELLIKMGMNAKNLAKNYDIKNQIRLIEDLIDASV